MIWTTIAPPAYKFPLDVKDLNLYMPEMEVPMVKTPPRYFRIQMTVPAELMEIIFDLIKGEDAQDVKMIEIKDQPEGGIALPLQVRAMPQGNTMVAAMRGKRTGQQRPISELGWVDRAWPVIRPVFEQANGEPLYYRDDRLINAVVAAGYRTSSLTPILSALARLGYVIRIGAGRYRMAS